MDVIKTIRTEIDRRVKELENDKYINIDAKVCRQSELGYLERFLDTLQEPEKPIATKDAMKELDDKIAIVKQKGTWDGVDVDKYMDEVRGREPKFNLDRLREVAVPLPDEEKEAHRKMMDERRKKYEEMGILQEPKMNLEKEINRYLHEECSDDDEPGIHEIAEHFAQWGYLRAAEKYDEIEYNRQRAEESVPNDLEEAAESFAFKSLDEVILYGCTLSGRRACFLAGAEWQKEQMMEEAVEGVVKHVATVHYVLTNEDQLTARLKQFQDGDKVRIIIVKE